MLRLGFGIRRQKTCVKERPYTPCSLSGPGIAVQRQAARSDVEDFRTSARYLGSRFWLELLHHNSVLVNNSDHGSQGKSLVA